MSTIELKSVTKSFGPVHVIHGVDLQVNDGEFVVFVGPSGCGKSTLLRIIAGLEDATGGDITLDGRRVNDVPAADRGLAMVFQSYALYPHMSVRQNLAFGLENARLPKKEIEAMVTDAARSLRIEEYLDRKPRQLSGGQRQRVAIGRAIVRRPGVFLLDEPLSNLDAELRVVMRAELAALHKRLAATMIYVTHDQVEAMTLADKIVVLRAGRVEQVGRPLDLFNRPANRFVAGFIGSPRMNFVDARVASADASGVVVRLADGTLVGTRADPTAVKPDQAVSVGIRPQHVEVVVQGGEGPSLKIRHVEQLGAETVVYLASDALGQMTVALPMQFDLSGREEITLGLPAENVHLFDADGLAVARAD